MCVFSFCVSKISTVGILLNLLLKSIVISNKNYASNNKVFGVGGVSDFRRQLYLRCWKRLFGSNSIQLALLYAIYRIEKPPFCQFHWANYFKCLEDTRQLRKAILKKKRKILQFSQTTNNGWFLKNNNSLLKTSNSLLMTITEMHHIFNR